ncbi:MAG: hypothetical protein M0P09_06220 [Acholeplasmataceae bacterium]|nr:hypothetical protein [Acholeplasmataceae bacterium]
MIRCIFIFLFSLFSFPAFANNISIVLKDVPAVEFLKKTYLSILGQDYILDPDLNQNKMINLSVSNQPLPEFKKTVDLVLEESGIFKREINGITFFSSKKGNKKNESVIPDESFNIPSVPSTVLTDNVPSPLPLNFDASSQYSGFQTEQEFEIYKPINRTVSSLQALVNSLSVIPSQPTNDRVVIRGPDKKSISKILDILRKYDSERPKEIYLEAAILEFTDSSENNRGFTLAANVLSDHLRIGINTILSPFDSFIGVSGSDINSSLSILSYDNRFTLVSAPKIRIFDGETGIVNVGQSVPTLAETTITDGGTRSQSIQYRDSGVILRVTPKVHENLIHLDISTELSNFIKTQTSGIDSPTLTRRSLDTFLTIKNNEMVILGGLDESKNSHGTQGVWFLPKFMDSDLKSKSNSQILVVLQAKLI